MMIKYIALSVWNYIIVHEKQYNLRIWNKNDIISNNIKQFHQWEREYCQKISHVIKLNKYKRFLDVGANIGTISLCIYANCHLNKLHSIEGSPWNYVLLNDTIRYHNTKVWTAENSLVASQSGETKFIRGHFKNIGGSSAVVNIGHPQKGWTENPDVQGYMVSTTLDKTLKTHECYNVMKMDIEGYEGFALQGFRHHLSKTHRRPCHIFMEWHLTLLKVAGRNINVSHGYAYNIGKTLKSYGYNTKDNLHRSGDVHWFHSKCCLSDL